MRPRTRAGRRRRGTGSRCDGRVASLKARGQRCWWTSKLAIVRRRASPSGSPRRTARGPGARRPSSRNGTNRRTLSRSAGRADSELGATKIAGLGGKHQLDRGNARSEADHLLEPSRRQGCHRHPVFDPLGLGRRDEIERDGLGEQPRLDRDRLDRDAVLAERTLHERGPGAEALGEARQVALQELHRALGRRRDHRGEREPGDVERGREWLHLEVADRDDPVLGDDDKRDSTAPR